MAANPFLESRYFSLWLDMSTPGGAKNGYELRFTAVSIISNVYNVTLAKWQAGAQTVLASKSNYSFVNGNSFAVVDQGGTVSAWTSTGSGFNQLLSASDSAFSGGNTGIEGSGNISRLTNFKAGGLNGDTQPPDTTISAGPTGTIGSSSASLSFTATEQGSTFQCSLDGAAFAVCTSPKIYEGLADGSHLFRVRAIDPAGNQDPSPAERSFQVNTLTNSVSIDSGSYRSSGADVAGGGTYNYAPSVMLDGPYRMWWCAGIAGDHIIYAESGSLNGPFTRHGTQYQDVLQPTAGSQFDGTHVCDPSVIHVRGTYYMYYGGLTETSGHVTQIGVASSPDGVSWTKMNNDNPIVTPREPSKGGYGAGQPSAAYVDGYFY